MHLRNGPTAEKGCALRCSRRSSADTISYSATCWKSPAPASLFKPDTEMKGRLQSCASPRERKEPSRAGCYASLQTATALGNVPHPLTEGLGKRDGPAAPERGLSVSHGLPLTPSLQVHEILPWPRDLSERTLPTAGWADVGRQRDPAFGLFPSSHPRPRASRAQPRVPTRRGLTGPVRGRCEPQLIPSRPRDTAGPGSLRGENGRRVVRARAELPARSVWLGQTLQRSLAGPDGS